MINRIAREQQNPRSEREQWQEKRAYPPGTGHRELLTFTSVFCGWILHGSSMSGRGVHFSLSEDEVQELLRFDRDCERLEHLREVIEDEYVEGQPERVAESDKAWDAMHRIFAIWGMPAGSGEFPLADVVLGGESIYGEDDCVMSLKTPKQVARAAAALAEVDEREFRRRYFALDPADYGTPPTEQDLAYTWEWFIEVREFWMRAAEERRYVLFTVDQ
jgi:hypothetical protein